MTDRPDTLVPAEVDLRGLPFMPLDVIRLMDSDLFALSSGDEFKAAVALWCKAWQQTPAGSLPVDDRVLAHLSGAGAKWKKVKAMALRGWEKCSDDRYYHALIAEKAQEAWEHRLKHRDRLERNADKLRQWREKKQLQDALNNDVVTVTETVTSEVTKPLRNLLDSDSEVTAKGQGQRSDSDSEGTENPEGLCSSLKNQKPKNLSGGVEKPTPSALNGKHVEPKSAAKSGPVWDAYSAEYHDRYGTEPVRNASVNSLLSQVVAKLGAEAPAVARFYVRHQNRAYVQSQHPANLFLRDAEGLRTQWATGQHVTATQAAQEDRTQTNLNSWTPLIEAAEAMEKANGKH